MGVAQWFSTPAVQISSFRQDGVTLPPEVGKENHKIYETEAYKMQGARQWNRDEVSPKLPWFPALRVSWLWARRWNPGEAHGGPSIEEVELRFQKTKVAGIHRTQCLRREKKGTERRLWRGRGRVLPRVWEPLVLDWELLRSHLRHPKEDSEEPHCLQVT